MATPSPQSEVATCDSNCVRHLTETFEAQVKADTSLTYSAGRCKTVRLRRWPTYNVGSQYEGTFGDGQGLIDARIWIRCVPYSGRDPVLVIRNFTFDSNLHIQEHGPKMGRHPWLPATAASDTN